MKFGGTSMGSAERIGVAARICAEQRGKRPVVTVVSAMSKVTDFLLNTLRLAESGDRSDVEAHIDRLRKRHLEACHELLPETRQSQTIGWLEALIAEFERIAQGILMLGERPPRSVDEAVAIGERLSAQMLALYLDANGTPAVAVNGADVVATDANFGNANPLM